MNKYVERLKELKKEDSKKSFKQLKDIVNKELLEELKQTLGKGVNGVYAFKDNLTEYMNSVDKETLKSMRKIIAESEDLGEPETELVWMSLEFKMKRAL